MRKLTQKKKKKRTASFFPKHSHSTLPVPATLGLCATHTCCVPQFPFCHCAETTLTERGRQEQDQYRRHPKGAHGSPAAHRPPPALAPGPASGPASSLIPFAANAPRPAYPKPTHRAPPPTRVTPPPPSRPAPSSQRNLPLAVSDHPAPGLGGAEAPRPPQIWLWRLASARWPDPASVRAEPGGEAAVGRSCRTAGREMVSRTGQGGRIRGKG